MRLYWATIAIGAVLAVRGGPTGPRAAEARENERPACNAEAIKWVQEHAAELPTTLGEFLAFAPGYRQAIHAALTPDVRLAMWREHFAVHAGTPGLYTDVQLRTLRELSMLLPALVGGVTPAEGRRHAKELGLQARINGLFSPTQARELFSVARMRSPTPRGFVLATLSTSRFADCNCSIDFLFEFCGPGGACSPFIVCSGSDQGCGPFGLWPCDGVCQN